MKKLLSSLLVLTLTLGRGAPCFAYTTDETGQSQRIAFGGNSSEPKNFKNQEKNAPVKNNFNPYKVKIKRFFRRCKNKIKDIANYKYVKEILIGSVMLFSGYKLGRNLGYDSAKKEFEPILNDKDNKLNNATKIIGNQVDALNKAKQALSICEEKCQNGDSTDSSNDFNRHFNYDNTEAENFLNQIAIKSDPNEFMLTEMNNLVDKVSNVVDKIYNALSSIQFNIFVAVTSTQNTENYPLDNTLNP